MCYKPDITGPEEIAITDGGTIKKTTLADALGAAKTNPLVVETGQVLTYNIPTDFPDLPAAFTELARRAVSEATQININIESGHELTKGLFVRDGDFARFYITSTDPTVSLASGFQGVSDVGLGGNNRTDNLIMGYNARMPVLATVIDMDNAGDSGYYGVWNCSGLVLPGCGVLNAGFNGLEWRNGFVSAYSSVWDGATNSGIRASFGASIAAQASSANDCCSAPEEGNLAIGAIDVSRQSEVMFRLGSANRSGASAVNVRRSSRFCGEEGTFDDALHLGVSVVQASTASLFGCSIQRTKGVVGANIDTGAGLRVGSSGHASAYNAVIKDSGTAIGGTFDVRFGFYDSASGFSIGGGTVDLMGCRTTAGNTVAAVLSNINLENFNVPYGLGIAYYGTVATGPLNRIGTLSVTGATSGKAFTASAVLASSRTGTSGPASHHEFYNANGQVGSITTSGSSTAYNTTSDETLKHFLGAFSFADARAIILADPVRRFEWIASGDAAVGWGAQTSHAVSPDLASPGGWFDAEDEPVPEGTPGAVYRPWAIDQSKRTPYLWAAVAGLIEKVAALEEKLNAH